tara:strand:+ start:180 stop:527 length:348 start_codon:yes stop_codon:yes gene_type:complete
MKEKLKALLKSLDLSLRIHEDSERGQYGFSILNIDVATFDPAPFVELLKGSGLGFTVTVFEAKQATLPNPAGKGYPRVPAINPDGSPRMLDASCYIGKSGATVDDIGNMLDNLLQ